MAEFAKSFVQQLIKHLAPILVHGLGGFLKVVITPARLANMILVIVVDFTEPQEIWNLVTQLHDQVSRRIVKLRPKGRIDG